jgi:hypothetical protein
MPPQCTYLDGTAFEIRVQVAERPVPFLAVDTATAPARSWWHFSLIMRQIPE